jgi:DNA-binding MarR family transcriptional regulator
MNASVSPLDREILSIIAELSKALRCCRQDEVFCEDVTYTQFIILDAVARKGTLDMARLHDALSVNKSTTTRLVAPLLNRNLLQRERAGHDSRAAILKLTETGKEVHEKVWQCLLSFVRAIRDEIPSEKRTGVFEGVGLFLRAMQDVSSFRCGADARPSRCSCSTPRPRPPVTGRAKATQRGEHPL